MFQIEHAVFLLNIRGDIDYGDLLTFLISLLAFRKIKFPIENLCVFSLHSWLIKEKIIQRAVNLSYFSSLAIADLTAFSVCFIIIDDSIKRPTFALIFLSATIMSIIVVFIHKADFSSQLLDIGNFVFILSIEKFWKPESFAVRIKQFNLSASVDGYVAYMGCINDWLFYFKFGCLFVITERESFLNQMSWPG